MLKRVFERKRKEKRKLQTPSYHRDGPLLISFQVFALHYTVVMQIECGIIMMIKSTSVF